MLIFPHRWLLFSLSIIPLQGNGDSDELLVSGLAGRKLPLALRNRMPVEATGHEAAALHGDEKPLVIRALETAAFGDQLDDEDGAWAWDIVLMSCVDLPDAVDLPRAAVL